MAWIPQPDGLQQTVAILAAAADVTDHARHEAALQQLEHLRTAVPDFSCYLTLVLSKGHEHGDRLRQIAGLHLKNNLKNLTNLNEAAVKFLKEELVLALGDGVREVRRTAAVAITNFLGLLTLDLWPELGLSLLSYLQSQSHPHVDGALIVLEMISEDHTEAICDNNALIDHLVPLLVNFLGSSEGVFRARSIACLNQYLFAMPNIMVQCMPNIIQAIMSLHIDPDVKVRTLVAQALVLLLEIKADYLSPRLEEVMNLVLHVTQNDPSLDVRREACEFWSSFFDSGIPEQVLVPLLPRLLPVLLDGMVYSDYELAALAEDATEDNTAVPDKEQDINPAKLAHHHSKIAGGAGAGGGGDDDDDDDDEDEDEDEEEDAEAEWSLRKCSAQALDIISGRYQGLILEPLLPLLHIKLSSPDWLQKESAILAAGAIATGCVDALVEKGYLAPLVDHLVQSTMTEPKPLLRSIACWTLSRYSKWVCEHCPETRLQPLVHCLLQCILNRNKKVQEAACSAFATLEEEAQNLLEPYLEPILQTMQQAFAIYQTKNMLVLYDAVGSLADSMGSTLNNPQIINLLMPPLITRWNAIPDTDKALFPLLECLTSVVQALGMGFEAYTPPVFKRCVSLIQNTLQLEIMLATGQCDANDQNLLDLCDAEFIVCSLDLISGMTEGLQASIESLVGQSNLLPLVVECCKHTNPEVRQSAFALVGDLAKSCTVHLRSHLGAILPLMTSNLDPQFMSVCNNATWALGEIAMQVREEMAAYVPAMIRPMVDVLFRKSLSKSLIDNTAITIGRLVFAAPDILSQRMPEFIQPLCEILSSIRDDVEKEDAFKGMIILLQRNPQAALDAFRYVCGALCSWSSLEDFPALRQEVATALTWYKENLIAKNVWHLYYDALSNEIKHDLVVKYHLQ